MTINGIAPDGAAGTGAPADAANQGPGAETSGGGGAADAGPVSRDEFEALLGRIEHIKGSRDSLKAKLREQEERHRAELAAAVDSAEKAGDLAKANEALKAQIADLSEKAARTDDLEAAFSAHADALSKKVPSKVVKGIPDYVKPRDRVALLNAWLEENQTTEETPAPAGQSAPHSPPLPPVKPGGAAGGPPPERGTAAYSEWMQNAPIEEVRAAKEAAWRRR